MTPADRLVVGLNGAALLSPLTGIGQYTKSLAENLIASGEIDLNIFYVARWSKEVRTEPFPSLGPIKTFIKKVVPHPYLVSRALQGWKFHSGAQARRVSVYHEPNFLPLKFAGPTVVSIHDLSWIRYPETHPKERVAIMNRILPLALERVQQVITDSEFIRREVIDEFGVSADRVTTTLLAPRGMFRPRDPASCAATLFKHNLQQRSYFLVVGTLEPRKNVETAVRAHAGLPEAIRRTFPLVLVGMRGWLTSRLEGELKAPVERAEVRPLGFVTDDELANLYSGATALVYPSVYEGFGLPPLEAMACGTPVITSNVSSLPEVAGTAAVMHDPMDTDALRNAMKRFIDDGQFWVERAAASVKQAALFSWERCAKETIAVYRAAMST
ncbi:MAG TPA: glycosyltransferase family 1 protein [Burkholderiaceae bacterium]|nr:glycosyltransferase family 1 protein [Burkholderiaceae bacterium]